MVLTAAQLTGKGIVHGGLTAGVRPTTYDATVGSIIRRGREIKESVFTLEPREIIWLVSNEIFDMGDSTTGLATLKTSWTHQGVLALNVGIVDPGWNGPLATAVVNFSSSPFDITIGDPFLRLLFHDHAQIPQNQLSRNSVARPDYVRRIMGYSKSFSDTFLDMTGLSKSVAEQVFAMPRWGVILSFIALIVAVLAISIPVGVGILIDANSDKAKIATLEVKVGTLESRPRPVLIDPAKCQRGNSNGKIQLICPID